MDWWNDLTDWISSDEGWRVISGALIPFVAIVVAGIVAALIGRGATKRVVAMQEREARNAAVAGIVSAARKAATWGSLGHDERAYADHLAEDADIRLRLLPVAGAPLAANWTQHEIADIKKNSSTFSFQAEQSLAEFRDRLLEWQARPGRARKLFKSDLERWKFDSPDPDAELIKRQQDWNADSAARRDDAPASAPEASTERPTPTTTSLRPALQRPAGTASPGASAASSAATTPISDGNTRAYGDGATRSYGDGATAAYGDGATRAYGDGATTPLSGTTVRPTLGSPVSPSRTAPPADTTNQSSRNSDVPSRTTTDADNADAVDDGPTSAGTTGTNANATAGATTGAPVPPPVAKPTSADAHVNRSVEADSRTPDDRKVDAPGTTNTTSIPTRIADAPAEPTDANETSEAPYTQPISASELRRRAADDDE
ncbi:hypothetical protein ACRQ4B_07880 [Curtobacterium sp. SP.BCo]|uniref:hypothetical protein n=1 Tax=Curtobacterium sp. SP.BCo TaxID=3435229 RepID=UPI003F73D538